MCLWIFIFYFFQLLDKEQPSYMNQSLEELGIGSYKQIATVRKERERERVGIFDCLLTIIGHF